MEKFLLELDDDFVCASYLVRFVLDKTVVEPKFINYFFNTESSKAYLKALSTKGVSQSNINPTVLKKNFKIPLLSLSEQKEIVEALSIWDQVIEKLDRLISVKEKQFKWLLKKLISDQKNNPRWRKVTLGELGSISSAGVDKKIIDDEKAVRLVNYLDVLNKNFIYSDDLDHWVTAPKSKIAKCDVQKGDIFFTPSSEIQGDIAHSAVAMENIKKAVYSYHVVRFRLTKNWDILFRGYIFRSDYFYKQAYSLCQGSGQRYVLSQDDFRKMNIHFPSSVEEQKKIASILNAKEKEIKKLKQLSEKYHEQKKGLMQKLLTGKWRIKV